jgi:hypothetical protein
LFVISLNMWYWKSPAPWTIIPTIRIGPGNHPDEKAACAALRVEPPLGSTQALRWAPAGGSQSLSTVAAESFTRGMLLALSLL